MKKFYFTLISVIFIASCVPQTKQIGCESNEAFNASLRTCVPVVNESSSFIRIDEVTPNSSITRFKNDSNPMTFKLNLSNPMNQDYQIQWKRSFNGEESYVCNNNLECSLIPSLLEDQVGAHVLMAEIRNTSGTVVDTHYFNFFIVNLPRPIIVTGSLDPSTSTLPEVNPTAPSISFSFTINNNGAVFSTDSNYHTRWFISRNGSDISSELSNCNLNVPFTSTVSNETHSVSLKNNIGNPCFNPSSLGVGNYTIRAEIRNENPGELVDSYQWSLLIKHPPLSPVIGRPLYKNQSTVPFNTKVIAYNGISYNDSAGTPYNFIPEGQDTQADFCVEVSDGEGSYPDDDKFVKVNFYLDDHLIYEAQTTGSTNKVCLTDSPLSSIVFNNTTPNDSQAHEIIAKVYDERLNQEYQSQDVSVGTTYPIKWNVEVRPTNTPPLISFSNLSSHLTCSQSLALNKSGCTVQSDTDFTVGIRFVGDDFYSLPYNEAQFNYEFELLRNGNKISGCTKSTPGGQASQDEVGPDYECTLNVPSFDNQGAIDVTTQIYQIRARLWDLGSPLSQTPKYSSYLTWDLVVTEKNTPPEISQWSVTQNVDEGGEIEFSATISDPEKDNFNYEVRYCTNASCDNFTVMLSGTVTNNHQDSYNFQGSFVLPENFLLNLPDLGCDALDRNETCDVRFYLWVQDIPSSPQATSMVAEEDKATSTIKNINPPPTLTITHSSPNPAKFISDDYFAFVGHPLSISNDPDAILTDASKVNEEKTFRYQWFVKNDSSVINWGPIQGATQHNLVWTPSYLKNMTPDEKLYLLLCVEDRPVAAASEVTTNSVCNTANPWELTVINNILSFNTSTYPTLASVDSESGKETAIWYETPNNVNAPAAYVASLTNNKEIFIKKVVLKSGEQIDPQGEDFFIRFLATPDDNTYEVKNLSLTGDDDHLYVAYLASRSGNPNSFYPQVRRIDLRKTPKKENLSHPGIFGFDYDGLGFQNNCNPSTSCQESEDDGVQSITLSHTGSILDSFALKTPKGDFTVSFNSNPNLENEICSDCSASVMANQLRDLINSSESPVLAGYSAESTSGMVTLHGARKDDFFDSKEDQAQNYIADTQGDIYLHGGSWYLPFIDKSSADKISFYQKQDGFIGRNAEITTASSNSYLESLGPTTGFDSYYTGSALWVGMIKKIGSTGKLYKLDPANFNKSVDKNIFGNAGLSEIKVAASDSRVFVGAVTSVDSQIKIGVYDQSGTQELEVPINDGNFSNSKTQEIFNSADIAHFEILPYGNEARIFATSKGVDDKYKLYVARLWKVGGDWKLSCGDCESLSESTHDVSPFVRLGAAPIREKDSDDDEEHRLSKDGHTQNEGIKDVAFISFGQKNADDTTSPAFGIFNMEGEGIGPSSLFTDTEDAGLFRPPFIKNE